MNGSKASNGYGWPYLQHPAMFVDAMEHAQHFKPCFGSRIHVHSTCKTQQLRGWKMLSIEEAFSSLEWIAKLPPMDKELPSVDNLISIVQKCRKRKNLAFAKRLHTHICDDGLEAHLAVRNHLVPMFVECEGMPEAQRAFQGLLQRNEYTWNFLIQGYTDHGEPQHALNLFGKMRKDCVCPNSYTFQALLKACTRLKCAESGQEVHAEIVKEGLEKESVLGGSLVDMYAKCGAFQEAHKVIDELSSRNVISWTALIAGYVEHALSEEALICLEKMQLENVFPDAITFVCSLKACGIIGAIGRAREIQTEILREGLEEDPLIGSALVDMYAKCGSLAEAQDVFDELQIRDRVSWTALITGYVEEGLGEEALDCLRKMELECLHSDTFTFVCSLKGCGSSGHIDKGRELHGEISKVGLERDLFVGSSLLDMYGKCGFLAEAWDVFNKLPVQDGVSWTSVIACYVEQGFHEEALNCLEQMKMEGVSPTAVTLVCSLNACGGMGSPSQGRKIHNAIIKEGLERDPFVGSSLVDMYIKCGLLAEAQEVLGVLPVRDVVSWNALMAGFAEHSLGEKVLNCLEQMQLDGVTPTVVTFVCSLKGCANIKVIAKGQKLHSEIFRRGYEKDIFVSSALVDMYAKCGCFAEALQVFDTLSVRNVVSWNALITGYAERGLGKEALGCMKNMQLESISLDVVTYASSLKACSIIGSIDKGEEILVQIVKEGFERDPFIGNALVDVYAKCGLLAEAQKMFEELIVKDVVSWNALIAGYSRKGESELVFQLFKRMEEENIKPDGITFLTLLSVCSHAGLVVKGQKYFNAMSKEYGVTPTIEHHNCMVDLWGRAGQLDEAVATLKKMPFPPNLVTWSSVLSACRKWGNVELGRQAFDQLVRLDKKQVAPFIMMSSIYADAHMWDKVRKIEEMRSSPGERKEQGKSWIEIGESMHTFVVGDERHYQNQELSARLINLCLKMDGARYLLNCNSMSEFIFNNKHKEHGHSEMLAIVCGLINTPERTPIRVGKNLWQREDCHAATALISEEDQRTIICRDAGRLHVFKDGKCSCGFYPLRSASQIVER